MPRTSTHALAGASLLLDSGMRDRARLAWRLFRDERVPALKYAIPALVALYVVSPIDPIPDFLLGIGQVDDLGIVIAALMMLLRIVPNLAPEHIVDEHLRAMGKAPQATRSATASSDGRAYDARYTVRE